MDASDKDKTIAFLRGHWPPADALALYNMGWQQLRDVGKIPSIRAALAVYECRRVGHDETDYERTAVRAVESWVVNPDDAKRKALGEVAGMQEPGRSFARNLANMASRSEAWRSAVAYNLTGNPHLLSDHDFQNYRDAIYSELMSWATGAGDPVAERLARGNAT